MRKAFHRLATLESHFPDEVALVVDDMATSRLQADYDHLTMDDWTDADDSHAIIGRLPSVA